VKPSQILGAVIGYSLMEIVLLMSTTVPSQYEFITSHHYAIWLAQFVLLPGLAVLFSGVV